MLGDRVYEPFHNEIATIAEYLPDGDIKVKYNEAYQYATYMVTEVDSVINIDAVLRVIKDGKRCAELTSLYELPLRDLINWLEFPLWARPNCELELARE